MVLHYGDLIDGNCLVKIINQTKPTEIYNLGAQSHVKVSTYMHCNEMERELNRRDLRGYMSFIYYSCLTIYANRHVHLLK